VKRLLIWPLVTFVTAVVVGVLALPAFADTRAPSRQTFTLSCGGTTVTFVSPSDAAAAAQVTSSTGVGILEELTLTNGSGTAVLFQTHEASTISSVATVTDCTQSTAAGVFTFVVLITPQR
jgi:hypothetical protein